MSRASNKAQRLLTLVKLLKLKPWTARELATYLDIDKRMVLRDLEALRADYQIIEPAQHHYRIPDTPSALNPLEALAVHAAVRLLYHHSPTANRHYSSALEKLAHMLPEPARSVAVQSAQDLHAFESRQGDARTLDIVAQAWFSQQRLSFDYRPLESEVAERRKLETYLLEVNRNNLALYAIGLECTLQRVFTYKLSRMSRVEILRGSSYTIPEDFAPSEYLSAAWGIMGSQRKPVHVQLRFSPEAARRIREGGYPNLRIQGEDAEGWLEVTIRAGTDNQGFPTEILPWVQSWGPRVEVLAPQALRDRWLEQATAVAFQSPHLQQHIASLVDAARQDTIPMNHTSEPMHAFWAKTNADKSQGYSLLGHLLDVAAVAKEILEREPESTQRLYAEDLGIQNLSDATSWVAALVGLHDIGKATPAFQQKWSIGKAIAKQAGFTFIGDKDVPHGQLSQKILQQSLKDQGFSRKIAKQVADAVGAHHGFRSDNQVMRSILASDMGNYDGDNTMWHDARNALLQVYFKAVGVVRLTKPRASELSGAAFMRLAGLTSFADWIGSDTRFFPTERRVVDPKDFYEDALTAASRALNAIGWERRSSLLQQPQPFERIFPFAPNALQQTMAQLAASAERPSLFIVEAPMGEGKTEAAFYAHALLQQKFQHRGMYVALPTQATGNAMFTRTRSMLESFGCDTPPDLQLLHGASLLVDAYTDIHVHDIGGIDEESNEVYARAWFTNKKRALLSENGVGTVDQALLSTLNIRHHFVRMWGLGNRTVVFDEVHAYQLYTSTLIERLVTWLHALGSSVIIMSATLPRKQRLELMRAFGAHDAMDTQHAMPETVPYPRITRVSDGAVEAQSFAVSQRAVKRVQLARAPLATEAIAHQLSEAVASGGCAVAIVNTVQRAQDVYQALPIGAPIDVDGELCGKQLADGTAVYLFHARYPANARQVREQTIVETFGKAGTRPQKAILIATQVVEQSLDLDFDVMLSDLAPIDLLLQRSGRMHRHPRARPAAHQQPKLYIAGLTDADTLPDLHEGQASFIYGDYILYRTWLCLAEREHIQLPDDFEELIETVYGEQDVPVPAFATEVMQKAEQDHQKEQEEHLRKAHDEQLTVIRSPLDYPRADGLPANVLAEDEEDPSLHAHYRPATRLGDPSITVIPLHRKDGKLFLEPDYRSEVFPHRRPSSAQAKVIYSYNLKLSRPAVVHGLITMQGYSSLPPESVTVLTAKGWQKNALLRYCYPLIFDDGIAILRNVAILFNEELGMLFQKNL